MGVVRVIVILFRAFLFPRATLAAETLALPAINWAFSSTQQAAPACGGVIDSPESGCPDSGRTGAQA